MNEKTKILKCACSSYEHVVFIDEQQDIDSEGEIYSTAYLSIHLSNLSFWKRLKYLFGYKCKYGSFEEILLHKENTKDLYEMLKRWNNGRK